jgi:hypothetical protein
MHYARPAEMLEPMTFAACTGGPLHEGIPYGSGE